MTPQQQADIRANLHIRRWRNQAIQREVRYSPIPAREAIEKMDKILDCIKNANRRIENYKEMIDIFDGLGFRENDIRQYNGLIENTKAAKLKLKKYFNKISRSIELFNLK